MSGMAAELHREFVIGGQPSAFEAAEDWAYVGAQIDERALRTLEDLFIAGR